MEGCFDGLTAFLAPQPPDPPMAGVSLSGPPGAGIAFGSPAPSSLMNNKGLDVKVCSILHPPLKFLPMSPDTVALILTMLLLNSGLKEGLMADAASAFQASCSQIGLLQRLLCYKRGGGEGSREGCIGLQGGESGLSEAGDLQEDAAAALASNFQDAMALGEATGGSFTFPMHAESRTLVSGYQPASADPINLTAVHRRRASDLDARIKEEEEVCAFCLKVPSHVVRLM